MPIFWTNPAIAVPVLGLVIWTIASCLRFIATALGEQQDHRQLNARVRLLRAQHAQRLQESQHGDYGDMGDVEILEVIGLEDDSTVRAAA